MSEHLTVLGHQQPQYYQTTNFLWSLFWQLGNLNYLECSEIIKHGQQELVKYCGAWNTNYYCWLVNFCVKITFQSVMPCLEKSVPIHDIVKHIWVFLVNFFVGQETFLKKVLAGCKVLVRLTNFSYVVRGISKCRIHVCVELMKNSRLL